jgi:hypothetical protein
MAQRGRRNNLEYAIAPIALKQIPTGNRKKEHQVGRPSVRFCSEVVEVFLTRLPPPVADRPSPTKKHRAEARLSA